MLGRYDTESKLITLIDRDYDPDESTSLLAHEFAHALQDQSLGLDRIWEGVSSEDEYMAVRSIVEGEAEHIGVAFYFAAGGDPLADWEWADVSRYAKSDLLEYVRDPEIPLLDTASSFPYLYGFAFMTEAYVEDGPSARQTLWDSSPLSTATIMRGYAAFIDAKNDAAIPLTVSHPSPAPSYTLYGEDRLGTWYLYALLLRLGVDELDAWDIASNMDTDSFGAYESESDVTSVWRMRFSLPSYARLAADGFNAADLALSWETRVEGDELFVFASDDDDALLAWAEQPVDTMTAVAAASMARPRVSVLNIPSCIETH